MYFVKKSILILILMGVVAPVAAQTSHIDHQLLWNDRKTQRILELTRTQREKLSQLKLDYEDATDELRQKYRELYAKRYTRNEAGHFVGIDAEVDKRVKKIKAEVLKITDKYVAQANRMLLPHQRDIQKEIRFSRVVFPGFIKQLTTGELDKHLNISPAQKKRLNKLKQELDERAKQKMTKMLIEIKDTLIDELRPEQQRKARALLADYEYRSGKSTLYSILSYERHYFRKRKTDRR